ncbi:MAG TPA: hypothetical protein VM186_09875 [Planctomycetota bacterium]|nr:hypothetical protein [Planctomycetota bacterium]
MQLPTGLIRGFIKSYKCRLSVICRLSVLLAVTGGMLLCWSRLSLRMVWMAPMARTYARRAGDFTVNVSGVLSLLARTARYRLNDGDWAPVGRGAPRAKAPFFVIELDARRLEPGVNHVTIEACAYGQWRPQVTRVQVNYDPSPVRLPVTADWRDGQLDIEEGYWETLDAGGERLVRPKPGYEEYDRIAVVAGAFAGGRSVQAEMTFRGAVGKRPFGFGVLSLWGGRPDEPGVALRRGWLYGAAWFYSPKHGVGSQFSRKHGSQDAVTLEQFRDYPVRPGVRYMVYVEVRPRLDVQGRPDGYHQRMKWWVKGEPVPNEWIEHSCPEGGPLRAGEYGVAIIAHRCQVEFGPVIVRPLSDGSLAEQDCSPIQAASQRLASGGG